MLSAFKVMPKKFAVNSERRNIDQSTDLNETKFAVYYWRNILSAYLVMPKKNRR